MYQLALCCLPFMFFFFFFQAEDGIRDGHVTGVQTCALPILITRSRVSVFTCVRPFNAFDAVAIDTPAVFATSARVGRLALFSPFLIIIPALSLPVSPLDLPPFYSVGTQIRIVLGPRFAQV